METKKETKKIGWVSNAPFAATGYGNQTAMFTPRLAGAGYGVHAFCTYGLHGAALNLGNVLLLPGSKDAYGNDMLMAHNEYYEWDLTMILADAWVYSPDVLRGVGNAVIWAPVDHDPVPPAVVNSVQAAAGVIAMSKFGEAQFKSAGLTDVYYVPHGVDSTLYAPKDQKLARKSLNIMDDTVFMVGIVAANKGAPSRKAFAAQIEAFTRFHKKHPDSVLYLHTDMVGNSGENIHEIIRDAGLPNAAVVIVSQYQYLNGMLGADYMCDMYNALDVLSNTSMGEGFGIPIMEAQMCGTPVMVTDCTAMSELAAPDSHKIKYANRIWTGQNSWQFMVDVDGIVAALETAYQRKKAGTSNREGIRQFALAYDADLVFAKYMIPAVEGVLRKLAAAKTRDEIEVIGSAEYAPDVTVVMPAYNAKGTIDRAIASVLDEQPSTKLELVIVDDGSTDGTWKHLRKWRKKYNVLTIKNTPGGGPVGALNAAIPHIRGKYVIKLDADDWFERDALKHLVKLLDDNPATGFAWGGCQYHGLLDIRTNPSGFNAAGFYERNPAIGEVMYRADAHKKHGVKHRGFWSDDNGRTFGPHDWDLCLQMIHDLKWTGATTEQLIHHYNHQPGTASAETKRRNGTVMAAFREQWPAVAAEAVV